MSRQRGVNDKLHIFLVSGHTFTFHKVSDLDVNESTLRFEYLAKSDEYVKVATFNMANVAGYSVVPS